MTHEQKAELAKLAERAAGAEQRIESAAFGDEFETQAVVIELASIVRKLVSLVEQTEHERSTHA